MVKNKDIRAMNDADRKAKLTDLRKELLHERGTASMGGAPASPGKIRAIRTSVARTLTIISEERAKKIKGGAK
ncbi:MAG: 50S ribosomal protein L29 [Candidatus Thermoplasmatota archaeon]|nr:50S ribosomal protein L29 [Candidatus Thermoplasmatota archaeon]